MLLVSSCLNLKRRYSTIFLNYGVYLSLKNFDLNVIHSADPVGTPRIATSIFVSNVVGT